MTAPANVLLKNLPVKKTSGGHYVKIINQHKKRMGRKMSILELFYTENTRIAGRYLFLKNQMGRNAAIAAKMMEGRRFATDIFLPQTRFRPTQNIKIEPTREI